ncbi:MAG: DUF1015 domain-containing protein [Candidatus Omnitrophica bacterium]|nr:DUF1015 domain-containing protein [Candidatus Omnitrophota bacterium]
MATVIPFRAWRYEASRVKINQVVAPPYDVISPSEQEALYARDPHNIVRIELTREEDASSKWGQVFTSNLSPFDKDKYEYAAHLWKTWIQEETVKQDSRESFYLYETSFLDPETNLKRNRLVIFGLMRLETFESKVILPHEKTHAKPKEDRFKLLAATKTNFSPVFGLYRDPEQLTKQIYKQQQKAAPLVSFTLGQGEQHKLWQVNGPKNISEISKMFQTKSILIADGHHRYETALNYSRSVQRSSSQNGFSSDYVLMGFVELEDDGLLIFPIHRMIQNLSGFDPGTFLKKLTPIFSYRKANDQELHNIAKGLLRPGFGIRIGKESFLVEVKDAARAREKMPLRKPDIWYQLEVAQISHLAFEHLGIREATLEQHVTYTRSASEAIQNTETGKAALSFIVPPIKAQVMQEICSSGELMPQKSTYFYPKLGSGLLMYQHDQPI